MITATCLCAIASRSACRHCVPLLSRFKQGGGPNSPQTPSSPSKEPVPHLLGRRDLPLKRCNLAAQRVALCLHRVARIVGGFGLLQRCVADLWVTWPQQPFVPVSLLPWLHRGKLLWPSSGSSAWAVPQDCPNPSNRVEQTNPSVPRPHLGDARHLGAHRRKLLLARLHLHLTRAGWARSMQTHASRNVTVPRARRRGGAAPNARSAHADAPAPTCRAPLSASSWLLACTASSRSWCSLATWGFDWIWRLGSFWFSCGAE